MTRRKLSLPSTFLDVFGAPKYMAIVELMADLGLELNSAFIRPLPKFISRVAWIDSPFKQDCQFEDPFKDVHKSDNNYTQGRLF